MSGSPSPSGIVTLLTDFGITDQYVAAMTGVMLSVDPTLRLVDASHGVPPQRVETAAYLLSHFAFYYPPGTVHMVVVDPGVGSEREAVVALASGQFFVGPNNGFLEFVAQSSDVESWRIEPHRFSLSEPSATFHGRDLFAPIAARLASGICCPEDVGEATTLVRPTWSRPKRCKGGWRGRVLHLDSFGNVVTNLALKDLAHEAVTQVNVGGCSVETVVSYYSQSAPGSLVALFGSSGYLEVSVVNGNAAAYLGVGAGDPVVCQTVQLDRPA